MIVDSIKTTEGQSVDLNKITILFGPNNTGKTQTLDDILSFLGGRDQYGQPVIADELEYKLPKILNEWTKLISIGPSSGNYLRITNIPPQLSSNTGQVGRIQHHVWENQLEQFFESGNYQRVMDYIGSSKVFFLDAESRLSAASKAKHQNVGDTPTSLLQVIHNDESERKINQLRDAFQYVFDKDVALDYSGEELEFYVADEFNDLPEHPIKRYSELKDYNRLDAQGGGFRSFAGVILSLLASEERVVLIDEPRAFLHPAQAREMGAWVVNRLDDLPGQVVIATHDANFISGILTGESNLTMYRLSRSDDRTRYHPISLKLTAELSTDPVLSSQPVLESLFHRGVVVCEGDEDRSIYRSVIMNRLERDDYLFIHTYGKGKLSDVTEALTESKVPTAVVTDIDVLKNDGEFKKILRSTDMDNHLANAFTEMSREVDQAVRSSDGGWQEVKDGGMDSVPSGCKDTLTDLITGVREHGIFIVPVGELESWMEISPDDRTWIVAALEDISQGNYGSNNLRKFCARIDKYLVESYTEIAGTQLI
jgi:AAA15 family ATPase/GTPase